MNLELKYQVLLGPHVSEKSSRLGEFDKKQITFRVLKSATKKQVKLSIEELFNVKVDSVRIINVKPKLKTFRGVRGSRASWKKAYVTLEKGFDIDFIAGKKDK